MSEDEKASEKKNFKIMWWSNSPFVGTGYGVGTKGVLDQIKDRYDVRLVAFYGLEGRTLKLDGLVQYPRNFGQYGEDTADIVSKAWRPHVMVTFFDIWVGELPSMIDHSDWFPKIHPRWIAWFPVDHDPVPYGIVNQAKQAYRAISMSKFGKVKLEEQGVHCDYIAAGVDTKVFAPRADKAECAKWLIDHSDPINFDRKVEWGTSDFVVGINAAPKDPVRKGYHEMFQAFKVFLEQNPDAKKDAKVYMHAWKRFPGGWNLDHLAHVIGVEEYVRVTKSYYLLSGFNTPDMATMYGGFDVLANLARREGFGIAILEAAACGVPSIVTNFTSMPELVDGHGWVVPISVKEPTILLSYGGIADIDKAADALGEAYNHQEKIAEYGKASREFSLGYDWANIGNAWKGFLDDIWEDLRPKTLEERRLL